MGTTGMKIHVNCTKGTQIKNYNHTKKENLNGS